MASRGRKIQTDTLPKAIRFDSLGFCPYSCAHPIDSPHFLTEPAAQPVAYWQQACASLGRADPILGGHIRAHAGAMLQPRNDAFFSLARSIVGQQISVLAAAAVWERFVAAVGEIRPRAVVRKDEDTLRGCGLSRAKAGYILSLAEHFLNGGLDERAWDHMRDEAVIENLTQVKGIGRWTAEMFLIFHLLRPDVLPVGDLGLQRAIGNDYFGGERPTRAQMLAIAEPWRPFRSVATWYLWRSLDAVPVEY